MVRGQRMGLFIVLGILGALSQRSTANDSFVLDHRYRPADWQTAIGLPDDWQKSLVDKSGELLYDYPGALGEFGTRIGFELSEGTGEWVSQALETPKVPVVRTRRRWGDIEMMVEAFAVTDQSVKGMSEIQDLESAQVPSRIIPLSSPASSIGFVAPGAGVDLEFSSASVGWGAPIAYRFSGGKAKVVFGFCEGYWDEPGQRVLELKIDGVSKKIVDPVAEVGKNGVLLVTVDAVDTTGDGNIDIEVAAAPGAKDGNCMVSAVWVFDEVPPEAEILAGQANEKALAYAPTPVAGPHYTGPPRTDLMLVTLRNTGSSAQTVQPRIHVKTTHKLVWNEETSTVSIRNWRTVNASAKPTGVVEEQQGMLVQLPEITLEAGTSEMVVVSVGSNAAGQVWSVEEATKALASARAYWNKLDLPYGVIQVPDAAVQAQLDASIRNIYQAREIKDGLPSFQVGPTIYRSLWIVDGAFLLESITQLNRPKETRAGVQHMLTYQNDDGSFENIPEYWKENGIVLWVIGRHAQLTGDDEWLESVWPVVEDVMAFIRVLRERSRRDPQALSYDFIPFGYCDGGLGHDDEYSNAYWILIGMKEAVSMAKQLGRVEQAKTWQREYDGLWARFRTLAERDMVTDEFGNRMLPIQMTRPVVAKLQKGQWAFMHAAYPGLLFAQDDPILVGNLANLSANRCEGLVLGTGWDDEGLWGYAGSFFAHAQLASGEGIEAAKTAYAFANHASPLLAWREEQRPVGQPAHYVGDMPHNWASAEFIRLILHLILFERDDELHLFEGLPPTWLKPGAILKIDKALTRFGEVSLKLKVAEDGKTATLDVTPPRRTPATKIVVHGAHWVAEGSEIEIPTDRPSHLVLTLN